MLPDCVKIPQLTEALDLYVPDFIHCAATTCLADYITGCMYLIKWTVRVIVYCMPLQTGRKWLEETNTMASSQLRQCSLQPGVTLTSSPTIQRRSVLRRTARATSSAPEAGRDSGAVPPGSERMTSSTSWGMLRRGTRWLAFHFSISAL